MADDQLQVRVNGELVLDAGTCEEVSGPHGPERIIHPPMITLFKQVLAYLQSKSDPAKRPSGSMSSREGTAAAALTLRWGSYLAVHPDRAKPVWSEIQSPGTSRISHGEMARINIEAAATPADPLHALSGSASPRSSPYLRILSCKVARPISNRRAASR